MAIDARLLTPDCEQKLIENFNRVLALIDALQPEETTNDGGGDA